MLVLASRSPQRTAILSQLGIAHVVRPAAVEELSEGDPEEVALVNARAKAAAVAAAEPDDALVLGVDTIVLLGERIYGKPGSAGEARAMLTALAGERHEVLSGLCLLGPDGRERAAITATGVRFRPHEPALLEWYLASGEWRERAGGYAVQGRGAALVAGIEGDYLNVVGLPAVTLLELAPELLAGAR